VKSRRPRRSEPSGMAIRPESDALRGFIEGAVQNQFAPKRSWSRREKRGR